CRTGHEPHASGHRPGCDHSIFQERPPIFAAAEYSHVLLHLFLLFRIKSKVSNGRSHTRILAGKPAKPINSWSRGTATGSQLAVPLLLSVRRNSCETRNCHAVFRRLERSTVNATVESEAEC